VANLQKEYRKYFGVLPPRTSPQAKCLWINSINMLHICELPDSYTVTCPVLDCAHHSDGIVCV